MIDLVSVRQDLHTNYQGREGHRGGEQQELPGAPPPGCKRRRLVVAARPRYLSEPRQKVGSVAHGHYDPRMVRALAARVTREALFRVGTFTNQHHLNVQGQFCHGFRNLNLRKEPTG